MRPDPKLDLGAIAFMNELRFEARGIQSEINKIIAAADPEIVGATARQWTGCQCLDVSMSMTDDTRQWVATLSRPAGPANLLMNYISAHLEIANPPVVLVVGV